VAAGTDYNARAESASPPSTAPVTPDNVADHLLANVPSAP